MKNYWSTAYKGVTKEQSKDTGMALVLLLLLGAYLLGRRGFVVGAIVVHVVNMTAPQVFRPAAAIWFGVSHVLGHGRIPGDSDRHLLRRRHARGGVAQDHRRGFAAAAGRSRRRSGSVMHERNHTYTARTSSNRTKAARWRDSTMEFLQDLLGFFRARKKYWLLPIVVVLLAFGVLIVLTSGSAIAPFIYTLF